MSGLQIQALTKRFGALTVTDNVTLTIGPGERHAVIGPNGAGKTSLINQISGTLRSDSGRILLGGEDVTGLSAASRCRRGLGRTFQKNNLFLRLSVLENVRLAVRMRAGRPMNAWSPVVRHEGERREAEQTLAAVGLSDRLHHDAALLSYGEQRQLEIALALATRPSVLLLDEPTSGMSPAETRSMTELIAALDRQTAVMLVEHDMDVVFAVADRVTVLYYGRVLTAGTPREVADDPQVKSVYLGADFTSEQHHARA